MCDLAPESCPTHPLGSKKPRDSWHGGDLRAFVAKKSFEVPQEGIEASCLVILMSSNATDIEARGSL